MQLSMAGKVTLPKFLLNRTFCSVVTGPPTICAIRPPCPILVANMEDIDWSACPDIEIIPGKVSGAWLVVGTRIPADAVIDNAEDGFTAEQIVAEIYPSCSGAQ
jgi:uncharacterized protein (DUF433 family)